MCCIFSIGFIRCRLPGLHQSCKRKWQKALHIHTAYVHIWNQKTCYQIAQLMMTFQWIRHMGKLHLQNQVLINHADAICTGTRSKQEMKRREKQENFQKWFCPPYLNFLTYAPTTIHSCCSDIWAQFFVAIIRMVNDLFIVSHRWELPLLATVIAVNPMHQLHLICVHLTGMFSPKWLNLPSSCLLELSALCAALRQALLSMGCSW